MKKIIKTITLVLSLVIALPLLLCSCSKADELKGTWTSAFVNYNKNEIMINEYRELLGSTAADADITLTFNGSGDGDGNMGDNEFKFKYTLLGDKISLTGPGGQPLEILYDSQKGRISIEISGGSTAILIKK